MRSRSVRLPIYQSVCRENISRFLRACPCGHSCEYSTHSSLYSTVPSLGALARSPLLSSDKQTISFRSQAEPASPGGTIRYHGAASPGSPVLCSHTWRTRTEHPPRTPSSAPAHNSEIYHFYSVHQGNRRSGRDDVVDTVWRVAVLQQPLLALQQGDHLQLLAAHAAHLLHLLHVHLQHEPALLAQL